MWEGDWLYFVIEAKEIINKCQSKHKLVFTTVGKKTKRREKRFIQHRLFLSYPLVGIRDVGNTAAIVALRSPILFGFFIALTNSALSYRISFG